MSIIIKSFHIIMVELLNDITSNTKQFMFHSNSNYNSKSYNNLSNTIPLDSDALTNTSRTNQISWTELIQICFLVVSKNFVDFSLYSPLQLGWNFSSHGTPEFWSIFYRTFWPFPQQKESFWLVFQVYSSRTIRVSGWLSIWGIVWNETNA